MPKIFRLLLALIPVVALGLASPAHARGAVPVYSPDPIAVPAGKSVADVKQAVRKACFNKGYEIRETGAGQIECMYTKPGKKGKNYVLVVSIGYDAKSVRLKYKDSQDLDYDASSGTAHKTVSNWIRNLEREIRGALGSY